MSTVSTRVLKDQLSAHLRRAEAGERIVVLRDGRPVAALVPLEELTEWGEEARLAALAARGLVVLPEESGSLGGARASDRGRSAAAMVIQDRR